MEEINKKSEEIIIDDEQELTVEERLKIAESLSGILAGSEVTEEEAREERVKKYL